MAGFGVVVSAAQTTYYVNGACGDDAWSGMSAVCQAPDGPKRTIQASINVSASGDTVTVADGLYTGLGNRDIDFAGRNITLRSSTGDPQLCIIDCQATQFDRHRGFWFHTGETDHAVVDGLTIRNGFAISGGAVRCEGCDPTFLNCMFRLNSCYEYGGGLSNLDSSPVVANCAFSGNSSGAFGAGMANLDGSSPLVSNCTFTRNRAEAGEPFSTWGGAMLNENGSSPTVLNCTFRENDATNGGGMYNISSNPTITNCSFILNYGGAWMPAGGGGGVGNQDSSPRITSCVFSQNAAYSGSGMYNSENSNPTVTNCVFWGLGWIAGSAIVTHCDVQDGYAGAGNIDADPMFVRAPSAGPDGVWRTADDDYGDLRLRPGSPCIDAGSNAAVPADTLDLDDDGDTAEPLPFDLAGNPRFFDDPLTPDCRWAPGTCGDPSRPGLPIVDMGAFEFIPCPGDLDGDRSVGLQDLANLLAHFGDTCDPAPCPYADGDLDGDNDIDLSDLALLLANFGNTCP